MISVVSWIPFHKLGWPFLSWDNSISLSELVLFQYLRSECEPFTLEIFCIYYVFDELLISSTFTFRLLHICVEIEGFTLTTHSCHICLFARCDALVILGFLLHLLWPYSTILRIISNKYWVWVDLEQIVRYDMLFGA